MNIYAIIILSALCADFVLDIVSNMLNLDGSSKVEPDELYIKEIRVDEGITLKRFRAAAMGRAVKIHKPTSHIFIKVAEI